MASRAGHVLTTPRDSPPLNYQHWSIAVYQLYKVCNVVHFYSLGLIYKLPNKVKKEIRFKTKYCLGY